MSAEESIVVRFHVVPHRGRLEVSRSRLQVFLALESFPLPLRAKRPCRREDLMASSASTSLRQCAMACRVNKPKPWVMSMYSDQPNRRVMKTSSFQAFPGLA